MSGFSTLYEKFTITSFINLKKDLKPWNNGYLLKYLKNNIALSFLIISANIEHN